MQSELTGGTRDQAGGPNWECEATVLAHGHEPAARLFAVWGLEFNSHIDFCCFLPNQAACQATLDSQQAAAVLFAVTAGFPMPERNVEQFGFPNLCRLEIRSCPGYLSARGNHRRKSG